MDKKVSDIVSMYERAKMRWKDAIEESMDDFKFILGDQWTPEEKKYLLNTGRTPDVVYNKILPRLNNLLGTEQQNRRQIKFVAKDESQSTEVAELANQLFYSIRQQSRLEQAIEKAFSSGLIMSIPAWIEVGIELDEFARKKYDIKVANSFSVYPDPNYRDYFLRDCNWIIKEKWMSRDDIELKYGVVMPENATLWEKLSDTDSIFSVWNREHPEAEYYDKKDDLYKVLELQKRVVKSGNVYQNVVSGEYINVTNSDKDEYDKDKNWEYVTSTKTKGIHITTTVPYNNTTLFEGMSDINTDMFDVIPYCSFDYNHIKSESSSFVKSLKPIQKSYNKRETQYLAFLDQSINAPIFFQAQDKETKEEYEKRGNKPGSAFLYNNPKAPPFRITPNQVPYSIKEKLVDDEANMNDISAINSAMRGQSEYSDESGRLFNLKAQVSGVTVNHYFNNLSKTRKMLGEYLLETFPYVYGDRDLPAIISNEKGATRQILLNVEMGDGIINNIKDFKGKVLVDEGQTSTSYRQEKFMQKMSLMSVFGAELINPEWLLKDSELPDWEEQVAYMQQIMGVQAENQARQQALTEDGEILNQVAQEQAMSNDTVQEESG